MDLEGWGTVNGKKNKEGLRNVLIPSSSLLVRTVFSGNGRPRTETGRRVLKAKVTSWQDFKTSRP